MTTLSNTNKQQYERIPSIGENSQIDSPYVVNEEKGAAFVYYLVFCVCIGGFLFGYDTGGSIINIIYNSY
jgi:SP family myo-inositol transporter-like MFS transporter 13